ARVYTVNRGLAEYSPERRRRRGTSGGRLPDEEFAFVGNRQIASVEAISSLCTSVRKPNAQRLQVAGIDAHERGHAVATGDKRRHQLKRLQGDDCAAVHPGASA